MHRLPTKKRAQIVAALVEGNGIRATARIVGCSKNTVGKLVADLGIACERFADEAIRNVPSKRIQIDEIWTFCHAKAKNVPEHLKGVFGYGDVWTWVAIDADTKLVLSWLVGERNMAYGVRFVGDVASRVTGRPQVSTDGFNVYRWAVGSAFRGDVDYAQIQKLYGSTEVTPGRYSPPICTGVKKRVVRGEPDEEHVSTSYVERQNLTMRMGMRRMTRLTNGHSKKVEQLRNAVAMHFVHYNWCRRHMTVKATPAEAAGLADHAWSLEELLGLTEKASLA